MLMWHNQWSFPVVCVCVRVSVCVCGSVCRSIHAMTLFWPVKGHECYLVVIRETAPQVRVAAILVSEACSAWLSADGSPHHRHAQHLWELCVGGRVWLHCRSTEQSEREAQEINSGRPVSFSPSLDADVRASVSRKQFLSVVGVYDQVWESDQV